MSLKNDLATVRGERDQYKQALEFQNATLLEQKARYDEKLSKLPAEITKIKTKYEVIYRDIETWEGDKNATELENVDAFLRGINY
jgi:predicted nuclease with TOPRIM domain